MHAFKERKTQVEYLFEVYFVFLDLKQLYIFCPSHVDDHVNGMKYLRVFCSSHVDAYYDIIKFPTLSGIHAQYPIERFERKYLVSHIQIKIGSVTKRILSRNTSL